MATTTPNYGWPVPTSSDLVKNGATAIEALGDAADATMATMVAKSIVDAKGDIIAATAADTVARLAVGTDYGFLQALATETTGIRWNNAAWTSYTPTATPTAGAGYTITSTGQYTRIGKLCIFNFSVNTTLNGTGSGKIQVTLPLNARFLSSITYCSGVFRENGVTGKLGFGYINNATNMLLGYYDDTYPGGTGTLLQGVITYEVA